VKNTIGSQFDIGLILEAIKERGEIVTKVAYSDWKRAGDYSRVLTQHAIRMVQRNMTPGGDKNGADITWRSTRSRWRSPTTTSTPFVIVGGDSDFISLVENLKQYGARSSWSVDASSPASRCRRIATSSSRTRTSSAAAAA